MFPILYLTHRNEFEHIGVLGEGNFGVVFKARDKNDNRIYAIKQIKLDKTSDAEQKRIKHDINFLAGLNCPYIVRYYRSWEECAEFNCQVSLCYIVI